MQSTRSSVLEDHSLCRAVVVVDKVRHMCTWEEGHYGTHECSCGKFWLNMFMRPKE